MKRVLYIKVLVITCLSLALFGLMLDRISSNIYGNYVGTLMWGSHGSGPAQFYFPMDIDVDSSGNVFVADTINDRIQKFLLADPCPTGTQGINGVCFVMEWENYLALGSGKLTKPQAIDVDSSGNVFVADSGRSHILQFKLVNPCPTGTTLVIPGVCFVLEWGSPWPGIQSASIGQFAYPGGIAVDSSGNVFVADTFNDRIQKFLLANPCPTGTTQVALGVCFVLEWGGAGTGNGKFARPIGIAVDSSDNVFVVDTGNNRIQKFLLADPCPSNTTQVPSFLGVCYIMKWGGHGAGDGEFLLPRHIAVDSSDNLFVADTYNNRIQKFLLADPCPTGTKQVDPGACYITEWGYGGAQACINARSFVCHTAPNQFERPYGIAVDSSGNVFVTDPWVDRIHKFIDDIIPPTVTITYPINGATLIQNPPLSFQRCIGCPTLNVTAPIMTNIPPKLEIRATATDNVEVKKVEFYAKGTSGVNNLVGTDISSPYSAPLTSLAPDTYTLTAKAFDTAGNTKTSTPVTVSIK